MIKGRDCQKGFNFFQKKLPKYILPVRNTLGNIKIDKLKVNGGGPG